MGGKALIKTKKKGKGRRKGGMEWSTKLSKVKCDI